MCETTWYYFHQQRYLPTLTLPLSGLAADPQWLPTLQLLAACFQVHVPPLPNRHNKPDHVQHHDTKRSDAQPKGSPTSTLWVTDYNEEAACRALQALEHVGLVDCTQPIQPSINPWRQPVLMQPKDNRLPTASNGFVVKLQLTRRGEGAC